jgi:hypothetical protein
MPVVIEVDASRCRGRVGVLDGTSMRARGREAPARRGGRRYAYLRDLYGKRVLIGVLLAGDPDNLGEWLADAAAFDAAGADALWVDCGPEPALDVLTLTAALAVVTFRARLVVALPEPPVRTRTTLEQLSRGRFALVDDTERWEPVPAPDSREAWRATCLDATERGISGLLVPANPRLLDILRNPDDPGDRHDLQLAQG